MIFNQTLPAQGGGGGVTLHNVSAPEGCTIYSGGYEDGEYVGPSLVSSADFPEGVVVLLDNAPENVDVACDEYPEGGFSEVINLDNDTYYFMMPPFDCWVISLG